MIAVAKTGSGKTLGFLLPAFQALAKKRPSPQRGDPPMILVLAPTRELAVQIHDECDKFGRAGRVRGTCCYGGAPKSTQIRALQAGVDVLVATPGRLNDLIEMRKVDVSKVRRGTTGALCARALALACSARSLHSAVIRHTIEKLSG